MLSMLRTIWTVLLHIFRRPVTVQYPEEKPYLPPRYRGRIILSRDPDGDERCVGCYLCSAACPVDCIALQAGEREDGRRYPEFFRINFSRCIFCGLCEEGVPDVRHSTDARFRAVRFRPAEPGLRKRGPADRRHRQVPGVQLLPGRRPGHQGQGEGGVAERGQAGGREESAPVTDGKADGPGSPGPEKLFKVS